MNLFEGIEKLITEHGSAAILKERIALAKEQYSVLETKLSDSELRANQFESENQRLELDNSKLKEKIRDLEKQLFENHNKPSLEEIKERILTLVAQQPDITDAVVARTVGVGEQLATFHLCELEKIKLVYSMHIAGSDWARTVPRTEWQITQAGRSYLFSHGLLH